MKGSLARVLALTLVDHTLSLRALDRDFRWTRGVRVLLLVGALLGSAVAVLFIGGVVILLPRVVALWEFRSEELVALALVGSVLVVAHGVVAVSGQETRAGIRPFDAELLETAGYRPQEILAARSGVPVVSSALLTTGVVLVLTLPLWDRFPPGAAPAVVACLLLAVALGLTVRVAGTVLLAREPSTGGRQVATGMAIAFPAGFVLPVVLTAGRDVMRPLGVRWRQVLGAVGGPDEVQRFLVVEVMLLLVLGGVTVWGAGRLHRRRAGQEDDGRVRGRHLTRTPAVVLLAAPLLAMLRRRAGDVLEVAVALRWSAYGLAVMAGVAANGQPSPWVVEPAVAVPALLGLALTFTAAMHPAASLLAHRGLRTVLYAAEVSPAAVSGLLMASNAAVTVPSLLAVWTAAIWVAPGLAVIDGGAVLAAGLALSVAAHYVSDALLPSTLSVSAERIQQTLPQRLATALCAGLAGALMLALSGLVSQTAGSRAGLLVSSLVALGVPAAVARIEPRPWREP